MKICIHGVIRGRVQGVFYRENTRKKALALSINGWVKNNDDGTVELIACGEENQITVFMDYLKKGPPLARVDESHFKKINSEDFTTFAILK